jgi:adenylate kinase family enzyme
MPRFIMLCGRSGAGKTTLRNKILEEIPEAVVLSSDDMLEEVVRSEGISYQEAFTRYRASNNEVLNAVAAEAFDMDADVIWDETNMTMAFRLERMAMVPDHYTRVAFGFDIPDDVIVTRLQLRDHGINKSIPAEVIAMQKRSYQIPHFDEGFDQIVVVNETGQTQVMV